MTNQVKSGAIFVHDMKSLIVKDIFENFLGLPKIKWLG